MRPKRHDAKSGCAVEVTLSVIGGLWKPLILFHLMPGKLRFMELTRRIPNATQRMLTLQLRELEADGVVDRRVYPQVPPKVEYELTSFGRTLTPVLLTLRDSGDAYRREKGIEPTPQSCLSPPRTPYAACSVESERR
ncbi:winged helix-turn-helix transcriptional regulator [Xanthobacter wiegelii]|uniref:winged helix-turn-helix transcriptional regulator n=1 Tax=Xanthobacter wiegelii TaxID=3119913 RepID=UPI00372AAFB6